MDHMRILKQAWKILWSYRTLWVFGIILALTSPSAFLGGNTRGSSGASNNSFRFTPRGEIARELEKLFQTLNQAISVDIKQALIVIAIALVCVTLLMIVLFTIGRFFSMTALIRMVNGYEGSGEKASWKQGVRYGWSRAAWKLFLINLVIYLPVLVVFIVLFGCAALPVLLGSIGRVEPTLAGIIATIGMTFLFIFLAILVAVTLSLVLEIMRRVCVLDNRGVIDSIRHGWLLVRTHLKDVVLMWLILIGIRIGYSIALIPVVLLLLGIGSLAGGAVGGSMYFLVGALASTGAGWVAAAVVGGLVFLLILAVPLLFLNGLRTTYFSSAWTLAYREVSPTISKETIFPNEAQAA
jgi:hypothetical protein